MPNDARANLIRLTPEQATQAYAALVAHAGARPNEDDVAGFVYEFTRQKPTDEFRFQGGLGSGGKFRFPRMSVDCYPEDATAARNNMIAAANEALGRLREAWRGDAED